MRRLVLLPALLAFLVGAVPALAWTWPVDGSVLQSFTLAGDPYAAGQHRGIDVVANEGASVRAPAAGTVSFAGVVPAGGRSVTILTQDGFAVTLLHLGAVSVAKGDMVLEGAPVGIAGWSGEAEHAIPSIHLGIRVAAESDGYVDPLLLLTSQTSDEPPAESPEAAPQPSPAADAAEPPAPPPADAVPPAPAAETDVAPLEPARGADVALLEPLANALPVPIASVAAVQPVEAASLQSSEPPDQVEPRGSVAEPRSAAAGDDATEAASSPVAATPSQPAPPRRARSTVAGDAEAAIRRARRVGRPQSSVRAGRAQAARRHIAEARPRPAPGVQRAHAVTGHAHLASRPAKLDGATSGVKASETRTGEWVWLALALTTAAVLAAALAIDRRRRGGAASIVTGAPPPVLPAREAPNVDVTGSPPRVLPAARRDSHPRGLERPRRLERGGPGGPVQRPAPGLRKRRASV